MRQAMRCMLLWTLAVGCGGSERPPGRDPEGTAELTETGLVADTDTPPSTSTNSTDACEAVPEPIGDPATVPLAGACAPGSKLGELSVCLCDPITLLTADVRESSMPGALLEVVGSERGCTLLKRNNPFCDPPCDAGEACEFDDVQMVDADDLGDCTALPAVQDIGCVTIGGLQEDLVLFGPDPPAALPYPPFLPGALIELQTHGTSFGSDITLHGVGLEPIDLGSDSTWVIADQVDLPITWSDPGQGLQSTVQVWLDIDLESSTPTIMTCEFPDSGSALLPGGLLHELIAAGVSGFPVATVTRHTVDSTEIVPGGCVEFSIRSTVAVDVSVNPAGG